MKCQAGATHCETAFSSFKVKTSQLLLHSWCSFPGHVKESLWRQGRWKEDKDSKATGSVASVVGSTSSSNFTNGTVYLLGDINQRLSIDHLIHHHLLDQPIHHYPPGARGHRLAWVGFRFKLRLPALSVNSRIWSGSRYSISLLKADFLFQWFCCTWPELGFDSSEDPEWIFLIILKTLILIEYWLQRPNWCS